MAYKKRYYRKYPKKNYQKEDPLANIIAVFLVLLGFGGFGIYQNYMKENMEVINFYAKIILFIIVLILIIYFVFKIKKVLKNKKIEKERINNIPLFLRDLESKIKEFKPIRNYSQELLYHTELVGFLKNNYPDLKIEQTKDYARPDIIIDDIAIEVKGPTKMQDIKTIPYKINTYLPKWNYLFIVLFNISIVENEEKNKDIYKQKKQEILDNIIDSKKDRVFFIEI